MYLCDRFCYWSGTFDATSISKSIDLSGSLHYMPVLLSGMQFAGVKMGQQTGCPFIHSSWWSICLKVELLWVNYKTHSSSNLKRHSEAFLFLLYLGIRKFCLPIIYSNITIRSKYKCSNYPIDYTHNCISHNSTVRFYNSERNSRAKDYILPFDKFSSW